MKLCFLRSSLSASTVRTESSGRRKICVNNGIGCFPCAFWQGKHFRA